MNIEIMQYRACIGSFNLRSKKIFLPTKKKYKCQKYPTNFSTRGSSFAMHFLYIYLFIISLTAGVCYENTRSTSSNICSSSKYENSNEINISKYSYKQVSNFEMRYVNGNKTSKGIKICHWNKGHSAYQNKFSEIKNIIPRFKPQVLGISEANINQHEDHSALSIPDYKVYFGPVSPNGMIRLVVYVHKEISVKVRTDLMEPLFNSIWLEMGLSNKKKSLISKV